MADVFNSKHTCAEIEDILDSAGLVSTAEDETYSVKIVDSAGTLLLGIKLTGELDVPIGITDDNYTLLKSICEKLANLNDYTKTLPTSSEVNVSINSSIASSLKDYAKTSYVEETYAKKKDVPDFEEITADEVKALFDN